MEISAELNQPFGRAQMLWSGAVIAHGRGHVAAVRERAATLIETCKTADTAFWLPGGQVLAGWAAVEAGDPAGLSLIRCGMGAWQDQQILLTRPYSLAVLAQACRRCGQAPEASLALSEAQQLVAATGERWYEAEITRLVRA